MENYRRSPGTRHRINYASRCSAPSRTAVFSEFNNNTSPLNLSGDMKKGLPTMIFSNLLCFRLNDDHEMTITTGYAEANTKTEINADINSFTYSAYTYGAHTCGAYTSTAIST